MSTIAAKWSDVQDVPQDVLDYAAAVVVSALMSGKTIILDTDEATAILCALAEYTSTASNALNPR